MENWNNSTKSRSLLVRMYREYNAIRDQFLMRKFASVATWQAYRRRGNKGVRAPRGSISSSRCSYTDLYMYMTTLSRSAAKSSSEALSTYFFLIYLSSPYSSRARKPNIYLADGIIPWEWCGMWQLDGWLDEVTQLSTQSRFAVMIDYRDMQCLY